MMAEAHIHMPQVMASLTLKVRVTGMVVMKARLWLGTHLLKLAALVMGCGIEIEANATR